MIPVEVVVAAVSTFVIGFFVGLLVMGAADGTPRRWLELRHELRQREAASVARFLLDQARR